MDQTITDDHSLLALAAYTEAVSNAPDREAAFRIAEQTAGQLIGHRLFTVMAFHADTMEVQRCYSSNPERYPIGGRKQKRDSEWGRHVLEQGRHFIGYNSDDIRRSFDDHLVIQELGLESVLNMPIRCLGKTVGTMNLLERAGYYNEGQVGVASIIANGLAGALLV